MKPIPDSQKQIEEWAHATLRDLPSRRAPRSLEERVLAEVQRRAALPWWRRSFSHWPVLAQASFFLFCAAVVRLVLAAGAWANAGFDPTQFRAALAAPLAWFDNLITIVSAASGFCDIMIRSIPSLWIYGGMVVFATMYATLFGLGAAAYKALQARD